MSAEFEAAQEICGVLHAIDQNLDRIYESMPSRRERIATAAMQGMLCRNGNDANHIAKLAVAYADALIAELDNATAEANARPIAAAPDLLAALEWSLERLDESLQIKDEACWCKDAREGYGKCDVCLDDQAKTAARAAIVKAKSSS